MEDGVGGHGVAGCAAGGNEKDGESTQRAVPDEETHVSSSSAAPAIAGDGNRQSQRGKALKRS
jgi:hypothetical protein